MSRDTSFSSARSATSENIETVIRVEEEEERRATIFERVPHLIGSFVGTVYFVALQCTFVVVWVIANNTSSSFDQFPYPLLSLILCGEAVILSSFVLIRQNRTDLIANRRNHLDLQINLLAEKEITKVLQLLYALNKHMKVPGHTNSHDMELAEETAVDELAKELKQREAETSDD
jgi:uncharacterized membrane protein